MLSIRPPMSKYILEQKSGKCQLIFHVYSLYSLLIVELKRCNSSNRPELLRIQLI